MSNDKPVQANKKLKFKAEKMDRLLELMRHVDDEGIFYYRYGSWDSPQEGDRRDTGHGLGRNSDEVYTGGKWIPKIQVGSVGTDSITLHNGLNDMKVKVGDTTINMVRNLKTMEGLQFGSSFLPFVLTSNTRQVDIYYPNTNERFTAECQTEFDAPTPLPAYYVLSWDKPDAIVKSLKLKTAEQSRARFRLYVTEESEVEAAKAGMTDDSLVYESTPDSEYKNPENTKCYGGHVIPKGDSEIYLHNEMYLTLGRNYLVEIDSILPSYFLGDGSVPYFVVTYYQEKTARILCDDDLETRLQQDIILDREMWLLTKGREVDGKKTPDVNVGGIYGDDMHIGDTAERTFLQSKGVPQMRCAGTPVDVMYIASENFVRDYTGSKVFDGEELEEGQTGLVVQTIPKTYTKYAPTEFPLYQSLNFLKEIYFKFIPNPQNKTQFLFGDFGHSIAMQILYEEKVIFRAGYWDKNGEYQEIEIDTNSGQPQQEGYQDALPYVPEQAEIESKKTWEVYAIVTDNVVTIRLTDPNMGTWQYQAPEASHIAVGGKYEMGNTTKRDRPLQRLWDIRMETWDSLEEPIGKANIDETVTGLLTARLVTRFNGNTIDILDPIAVHKYADLTKDFHTFFVPSGLYRCFGMTDNLPEGYIVGDNDFYVDVYTTSKNYKCLEAIDIRTGRKFIKNMYNGLWKPWVETGGVGSVPLIPRSIYVQTGVLKGGPDMIPLDELGASEKDTFLVSCGTRGMAVRVYDPRELERYAASYYVSDEDLEFIYYLDAEGTTRTSLEIFKYVPIENAPPKPWHPYMRLIDVEDALRNDTQAGQNLFVELNPTSWELVREPLIIVTLPDGDNEAPLMFDGKSKYYFEFPINMDNRYASDAVVQYQLLWKDQNGIVYSGIEKIKKPILT